MSARPGRSRLPSVLVAAVAVAVLTGCGTQDASAPVGSAVASTTSSSAEPVTGNTEGASSAQIAAAKLASCPASDPDVTARPDGLPDLTLPCLGQGPDVRLAGVRGKPMVVNVWASWCGPCRAELPILAKAYQANSPAVEFLGVDLADDRAAALEMAGATGMGFPSVQDPKSKLRAGLAVVGVPTTLFVRPDGSIAGRTGVITSDQQFADLLAQYLQVKAA